MTPSDNPVGPGDNVAVLWGGHPCSARLSLGSLQPHPRGVGGSRGSKQGPWGSPPSSMAGGGKPGAWMGFTHSHPSDMVGLGGTHSCPGPSNSAPTPALE